MKKITVLWLALLLPCIMGSAAQAVVVVDFSLSDWTVDAGGNVTSPIGGPFTATDVLAPGVAGARVIPYGLTIGGSGNYAGELNYASWNQLSNNDRLEIEITMQEGLSIELTSLTLNIVRNGSAAPQTLSVSLAADDVVVDSITNLATRSGSEGALPGTGYEQTFDLSSTPNQSGTFILWVKTPDSGKVGNLRINNIVLEGNMTLPAVVSPTAGQTGVAASDTLQWKGPFDPNNINQANAHIVSYTVYCDPNEALVKNAAYFSHTGVDYFSEQAFVGDPATNPTQVFDPVPDLAVNTTYYWRVDTRLDTASEPNDVSRGAVWSFNTNLKPVVSTQPTDLLAASNENAAFTVVALDPSGTGLSYQWYKDPNPAVAGDEIMIPSGIASTLTIIAPLSSADEGYYYCEVSNLGGTVKTDSAHLAVKRLVLSWAMENNFLDSSGEGSDGVIDTDPNFQPPTFDLNTPGASGVYSASFNGTNQRIQAPANKLFSAYTLTMWVKAASTTQTEHAGLFNNNSDGSDFQIEFDPAGNYRYLSSAAAAVFGPASTEWVHLAVVCDGTDTTLYYNLSGDNAVSLPGAADIDFGQFQVGCNRGQNTFFAGLVDDVKVWNYARSYADLVSSDDDPSDYVDVTGRGACQSRPELDLDGDCEVGLSDFVIFAKAWLECGLIPNTMCN